MAKIVCVIGNKGGTGKTTLSHMIARGMGLLGKRAVCVLTDTHREKLDKQGRGYLPFDAREPENFLKVMRKLSQVPEWYGVIDGGGNRPAMDARLAKCADLVILPFRDSHEDIRCVLRDLDKFSHAWALPSQWPTNAWSQQAASRSVAQLMGNHQARLLEPLHAQSATKLLLQDQLPARLPSALNNSCRLLALQVFELLGETVEMPSLIEGLSEARLAAQTAVERSQAEAAQLDAQVPY